MSTIKQHSHPGALITFEGIDGAGKTVLMERVRQLLEDQGYSVIMTKEPGGTKIGQMLKRVLLEEEKKCHARVEYLLFAADRAEHFEEVVIPHLKAGSIILSDRMADSALAYQGYGRSLDTGIIEKINNWAMQDISPDLTFYIRVDYQTAQSRIKGRNQETHSTMEREQEGFWKRVITGYETIKDSRSSIVTLDGRENKEQVFARAEKIVAELLSKKQMLTKADISLSAAL